MTTKDSRIFWMEDSTRKGECSGEAVECSIRDVLNRTVSVMVPEFASVDHYCTIIFLAFIFSSFLCFLLPSFSPFFSFFLPFFLLFFLLRGRFSF